MTSSYDVIYEALLPKLAKCDLQESAARFGLPLTPRDIFTSLF